MKVEISCERCGFKMFIDERHATHAAGWRFTTGARSRGLCPACCSDEERSGPHEGKSLR